MHAMRLGAVVTVTVATLASAPARAQNVFWDLFPPPSPCEGDWMDPLNWVPRVPASGDTVSTDTGCGEPVLTDGDATDNVVHIGFDMSGNTLEQRGIRPNSLTVQELTLGDGPGSRCISAHGRWPLVGE